MASMRAQVLRSGKVHRVGQGAIGAGFPVLPAGPRGAGEHFLTIRSEDDLRVYGHRAGGAVDIADHILRNGGEARECLERPRDQTGLAFACLSRFFFCLAASFAAFCFWPLFLSF